MLSDAGVKVRLKAMAMRSTAHELPQIAEFCRAHTKDYFRFDPLLHQRYDGDKRRNAEIRAERLSPEEVVAIEQADQQRAVALADHCDDVIFTETEQPSCNYLFGCGVGNSSFTIGYDGVFRPCASLQHPDTLFDLRTGTLAEAWNKVVPMVRDMRSDNPEFLARCHVCPIINLCLWCPAHSYLESGQMDVWNEYFCQVAHARAAAIEKRVHESASTVVPTSG
jgi:radical SAM protein with 4Fe4S-binding SPASM domain